LLLQLLLVRFMTMVGQEVRPTAGDQNSCGKCNQNCRNVSLHTAPL
jgi:bacterioferritin-associated ferredoxin